KGGKFIRPEEITFGNNIFINNNFHISARNLNIGNDVLIGPNVVIECDDHIYDVIGKTMFELRKQRKISSVRIENDVWIGANVTILKNTVIGEGAIIGAGSVVTKNIPPYTIAVGLPCRPFKPRFNPSQLKEHLHKIKSDKNINEILNLW